MPATEAVPILLCVGRVDRNDDAELLQAFRETVKAQIARTLEQEHARSQERRSRVVPQAREAITEARHAGGCGRAWLFGSYAWGDPGTRSDVDLLVEGCDDPDRLAAAVARRTGTEVHVVQRERAPESLVARVDEEGVPL